MGKNAIISTVPNVTQNYLSKLSTGNIFVDSLVYDNGTNVMINTATTHSGYTSARLVVNNTGNSYLEVRGNGGQGALVLTTSTSTTSNYPTIEIFNSGNFGIVGYRPGVVSSNYLMYYDLGSSTNRALTFQTEGVTRLGIQGAGRILMGPTLPTDDGSTALQVNGGAKLTAALTGTSATFSSSVTATRGIFGTTGSGTYGVLISDNDQSNVRLRLTNTGTGGQSFSIVGGNPGASNAGLAIYDETNTATRLYISSSGNVGIGNTNPNSYSGAANQLVVGNTTQNNGITIASSTTGFCGIYFAKGTTGNEAFRGYIEYGHTNDYLAFGTAASERMRITSGGNVDIKNNLLIGTGINATQYIFISENQIQRLGNAILYINNSSNGDVSININGGGTFVNGTNGYGRAVTNSSDERIKKNITTIENALDKVLQMNGVYYEFNSQNNLGISVPSGHKRIGLIAQQIENILPESVFAPIEPNQPKSIDYSGMIGLMVNAIKEQQAQIESLKALINK